MISYKVTTTVLGIALFLIILRLVRRGKLQEKHSLAWFVIGIFIVILGIYPDVLDWLAGLMGIHYPPAFLFVVAVGILLVLNLYLFIFASQNEARIKKLVQDIAVLNHLTEELRAKIGEGTPPPAGPPKF